MEIVKIDKGIELPNLLNDAGYYEISKFINHKPFLDLDCNLFISLGERSVGKSYSAMTTILRRFMEDGKCAVWLRFRDVSFEKGAFMKPWMELIANGDLAKITEGQYNDFEYRSHTLKMVLRNDAGKIIKRSDSVVFTFPIANEENRKGQTPSNKKGICWLAILDEVLVSPETEIPNAFQHTMSALSTVSRNANVTVLFLGNTVNRFSTVLEGLDIGDWNEMKQGEFRIYRNSSAKCGAVVHMTDSNLIEARKGKENKIFELIKNDNPAYSLLTGKSNKDGQTFSYSQQYPLLQNIECQNAREEYRFFIIYDDKNKLCCKIMSDDKNLYLAVEKCTKLDFAYAERHEQLIFERTPHTSINRKTILTSETRIERLIISLIKNRKCFFSTFKVGNTFTQFLTVSKFN